MEFGEEVAGGVGGWVGGDFFGGACGYQVATGGATFGAEVDNVVGAFDYVHIVFDDDDGVALGD